MNHKLFRICNIPKSRRQKEVYMDKSMRIAVVYGGTSTERVPSLKGGHAVYEALQRSGFTNPILFDLQNHNIDRVLPEVELVSDAMYRSYEVKYTSGSSKHVIPARIPETTRTRIHEIGKNYTGSLAAVDVPESTSSWTAGRVRLYLRSIHCLP